MQAKTYIVYDQEPVRKLLDIPAILLGFAIPMLLLFLIPHHLLKSKITDILFPLFGLVSVMACVTISSKYITSNKIRIELNDQFIEVIFFRKKAQKFNRKIYLKDIVKTDDVSNRFMDEGHFRIHYLDNKIFAISKSTRFIIRDDFETFRKDLSELLKLKN